MNVSVNKAENDWEKPGESQWIVVDDNRGILQVVSTILQLMTNARIRCFESADEALKAFELHQNDVSLVITDLEMPSMNGLELCHELRSRRPDVKVLLMTGNHTALDSSSAKLMGFCGLIYKPFLPTDLRNTLEDAGALEVQETEFESSYARRH